MLIEIQPEYYDIFGYCGAVFLTLLNIPQVYHCLKNQTSSGLTLSFIILQFLTSISFLTFGLLINELPIIIANTSTLIGSILLFICKIIYTENRIKE